MFGLCICFLAIFTHIAADAYRLRRAINAQRARLETYHD